MKLSVVWLPKADADLKEARAWYDNIRLELGERYAHAIENTVEAIAENPSDFQLLIAVFGERESIVFRTEYFSRFKRTGLS